MNKDYWIDNLELKSHPEGGYYKETYRAEIVSSFVGFDGSRNVGTAIYYLLVKDTFSAFHRFKSDEIWHFYDGDPLNIYILDESGELQVKKLGLDIQNGQQPQLVVYANNWFACQVSGEFTLAGCTVSPGFDFQDFELGDRESLINSYHHHREIITLLTR